MLFLKLFIKSELYLYIVWNQIRQFSLEIIYVLNLTLFFLNLTGKFYSRIKPQKLNSTALMVFFMH